ncbi:hypothetical protein BAUCODRAFT_31504 [Baudoinia panamericana UAMH 10762]|uniref:Aquaporin n=1 Tax=Baudoinia panamericana (strain UAMH 10762) TaxID=717646 RepID=M2MQT1_BAUPA|nr:uncharacterized protein BAUCODRAFT_31504 [Baudoinia panamericana UAMH 10762]EMC99176.1 hypothetical protein BAUCODRAFT_31504 [Baudoinia panamericana UAMH 10762]
MLGVYTSGISGGHINPAVTFANCVLRKFSWKKFPIYVLAQISGAFCAAGVVYGNYKSAIHVFEGGPDVRTVPGYAENATAAIFATYPASFMTTTGRFFSEFLASALLMFSIYAVKDDGNLGAGSLTPLALFFILFGIASCFGWETGFAINPARDFGPRLMTQLLGYGHHVWTAGMHYFWVSLLVAMNRCIANSTRGAYCGANPRMHVRRLSVRLALVHRRESNQHASDGFLSLHPRYAPCLRRYELGTGEIKVGQYCVRNGYGCPKLG